MPRYTDAYRSRYFNAADLVDGDLQVTIRDAQEREMLDRATGRREVKVVLEFHDSTQLLPLNKVNYQTLVGLLGPDLDGWSERTITLYSTPCQGPQGMTDGIRIRTPPRRAPARPMPARPTTAADIRFTGPGQAAPAPVVKPAAPVTAEDGDDLPF